MDVDGPLQLQVTLLDYSSYVGAIGIGRIKRGTMRRGMTVTVVDREGKQRSEKITQILGFHGLTRVEVESAGAGDIVAFAGIAEPKVSDTLCDPATVEPLPSLTVDEPTISMTFEVNTSPFLGREGKFVTSRQIRERLERESIHNVALRVEPTADPDKFVVFGRGELHLGVLLENMRREGYEMAVSRPRVVIKQIDGVAHEPYEQVTVDADADAQGDIMSALGSRGAELKDMQADGRGRMRLDYMIPSRGLIGFQTEFRTMTRGTGLLHHVFDHYGPVVQRELGQRPKGVLIANGQGVALGLFAVQPAGARPAVHRPGRGGLRGHDHRPQQPRQRPGRQSAEGQEIDQHARRRQGRERRADAADPLLAGAGDGVHRRRRADRGHPDLHAPAQAQSARNRPQALRARNGRSGLLII